MDPVTADTLPLALQLAPTSFTLLILSPVKSPRLPGAVADPVPLFSLYFLAVTAAPHLWCSTSRNFGAKSLLETERVLFLKHIAPLA